MLENKAQNSSGKPALRSTKFHALSRVTEEGYVSDRSYFQYDPHGEMLKVVGFNTDITDRKRAEEELHQSQLIVQRRGNLSNRTHRANDSRSPIALCPPQSAASRN